MGRTEFLPLQHYWSAHDAFHRQDFEEAWYQLGKAVGGRAWRNEAKARQQIEQYFDPNSPLWEATIRLVAHEHARLQRMLAAQRDEMADSWVENGPPRPAWAGPRDVRSVVSPAR